MPDPYLWDQVARRLGCDLGDMLDLTNDWYATDAFTGASKLRKDTYLALPLAWEPISTGDKVLLPLWPQHARVPTIACAHAMCTIAVSGVCQVACIAIIAS